MKTARMNAKIQRKKAELRRLKKRLLLSLAIPAVQAAEKAEDTIYLSSVDDLRALAQANGAERIVDSVQDLTALLTGGLSTES